MSFRKKIFKNSSFEVFERFFIQKFIRGLYGKFNNKFLPKDFKWTLKWNLFKIHKKNLWSNEYQQILSKSNKNFHVLELIANINHLKFLLSMLSYNGDIGEKFFSFWWVFIQLNFYSIIMKILIHLLFIRKFEHIKLLQIWCHEIPPNFFGL